MKKPITLALQMLAVAGLMAGSALAPMLQDQENIRITQIDTTEFPRVTFYVSITDANGKPLPVDASRLIIMENGQEIPLDQIEGIGDVGPLTTLLVMDVSDSMNSADKLDSAKAAAHEFINRMRSEDQAALISFDGRALNFVLFRHARDRRIRAATAAPRSPAAASSSAPRRYGRGFRRA